MVPAECRQVAFRRAPTFGGACSILASAVGFSVMVSTPGEPVSWCRTDPYGVH